MVVLCWSGLVWMFESWQLGPPQVPHNHWIQRSLSKPLEATSFWQPTSRLHCAVSWLGLSLLHPHWSKYCLVWWHSSSQSRRERSWETSSDKTEGPGRLPWVKKKTIWSLFVVTSGRINFAIFPLAWGLYCLYSIYISGFLQEGVDSKLLELPTCDICKSEISKTE